MSTTEPTVDPAPEAARERRILALRERLHALGIPADDWDDEAVGRILRLMDEAETYRRNLPLFSPIPMTDYPPDPGPPIRFCYGFEAGPIMYRLPVSAYITGLA